MRSINPTPPPNRYHRQRLLPQIGLEGQSRLSTARVLIIGCGALGSNLAEMLARAGVGYMRIVDRDLVELTNLQRQVLFDEQDAKDQIPKSIAAGNRLREINSQITIDPIVADANARNIESLLESSAGEFGPIQLILDGTDNVATRYLLNDVAIKHNIPWVYAACVGTTGRVMPVIPGRTACLCCLFPEPPDPKNLPSCDTAGVLNTAAAAVASLQATWALRLLVAPGHIASHEFGLTSLDLWTSEFRTLASAALIQADCPCCQRKEFRFLSSKSADFTTALCGRDAVQVLPAGRSSTVDLTIIEHRWRSLGSLNRSPWFVRCALSDPAGMLLTLFPDGRLLVQGTTDSSRARSIYSRFVGT